MDSSNLFAGSCVYCISVDAKALNHDIPMGGIRPSAGEIMCHFCAVQIVAASHDEVEFVRRVTFVELIEGALVGRVMTWLMLRDSARRA